MNAFGLLRGATAAPFVSDAVGEVPASAPRSVFETAAFRQLSAIDSVIQVHVGGVPLAFANRGDHAVCLALTARLDEGTIAAACDAIFIDHRFDFVVFEDVDLQQASRVPSGSFRFHYQNDWVLALGDPEHELRPSFRRKMETEWRRMGRKFGEMTMTIERRPSGALVEAAIEFNRLAVEAGGRPYRMEDGYRRSLIDMLSTIGVASVIRNGDNLVAVEILVECGREAYGMIRGYDPAYHRHSPGLQNTLHAIDHFAGHDFDAIHFLWGDGDYKARVGARAVPLTTLVVLRSPRAWFNPRLPRAAAGYAWRSAKKRIRSLGIDRNSVDRIVGRLRDMYARRRGSEI